MNIDNLLIGNNLLLSQVRPELTVRPTNFL